MTYFTDIKPGDPLPPRPEDFSHRLVRVYPGVVQSGYRDEAGTDGGSQYAVECDGSGRQMETVGVYPAGHQSTTGDSWSPTGLYRFAETPHSWWRSQTPRAVRSSYDAACVEAGGFIRGSLEPFRKAVSGGRVSTHPLGALISIARPTFERLAKEFDYYAERAGRSLKGRVARDEMATLSFRDGVRFYTGVDLNHDGILDVLSVHDEAADRHLLIYDLERAPALVKGQVPRIAVPREEIGLLRVAGRSGGEACRSSVISHVPLPDYVSSEASSWPRPMRGLLYFHLRPKEPLSPLCARDLLLDIRFHSTEQINAVGHHRFRVVTDLDRFSRAQEEATRRGVEMFARLPDERWIADAVQRFEIPPPPPGRLWRIGSITSPSPEIRWTSDREGYVEIMLESISADGTIESHPFRFPFTTGEGQEITFLA